MKILFLLLLSIFFSVYSQTGNLSSTVAQANDLYKNERYDDALPIYLDLLKKNSDNPYLWFNLGNIYFKQKKYAEAREAYKHAKSFKDTLHLAKVNYNIGNTYLYESKLDTAIRSYVKSLEYDDTDKDAKYNLELARAILKEKSKKNKKSGKENKNQKKQKPSEYAKKLFEEAKRLAKEYKFKEAKELLQRGLKQDPTVGVYKKFMQNLETVIKILG